jgi:hypothetical protein
MTDFPLCSNCFQDQGLRLDASRIGIEEGSACPNCGATDGRKLSRESIAHLAHRFFVWGTLHRSDYGAAPVVQFNEHQSTNINTSPWFEPDLRLIEKAIGVGFFYYGPRLWMLGEVEPLKALRHRAKRAHIIRRIISEYPTTRLTPEQIFFRIRKDPKKPGEFGEYDSRPSRLQETFGSAWRSRLLHLNSLIGRAEHGRLDSDRLPVLYGSQDLEVCVHECRVTAEDDVFVATLAPSGDLRLLDLTELLPEDGVTEFESLDMAIHMLFLARKHSYPIAREIALIAHAEGYDGLVYPSYFSLLRTGEMPFQTTFGISHRRFPQLVEREKSKTIPNLALFGRPIEQGKVCVRCINKLILNRVTYDIHFGPVGHE